MPCDEQRPMSSVKATSLPTTISVLPMPENGTTLPRAMQRLDCRLLVATAHLRIPHGAAISSQKRNSNERTVRNRSSFLSPGDYRALSCAFQISRDGLAQLARACRSLSTDETIPSGNRPASATKAVVQELISIEAFPGISARNIH